MSENVKALSQDEKKKGTVSTQPERRCFTDRATGFVRRSDSKVLSANLVRFMTTLTLKGHQMTKEMFRDSFSFGRRSRCEQRMQPLAGTAGQHFCLTNIQKHASHGSVI
jgi:hypothetical protein